ncbi:MAG: histidine phosphotransferase family protein [Pseudomonadota bacterium]
MSDDNKNLAAVMELLASRICHDLISPVGAIHNGIEFMEEMGADAMDDALGLIKHSASQSTAKLQAFRMAYGAGGHDANLKPEDVQKCFGELIAAEKKISQMWDPYGDLGPNADGKDFPAAYAKMLMGTMMLAQETLMKGGDIMIKPGEGAQTLIIAMGEGVTVRDQVEDALKGDIEVDDLDPRLVHPYALGVLARGYGYTLSISKQTEERVQFTLDCPSD